MGLCKHSPKDMPQTKGSKNTKFSGKLKFEKKKLKQRLSRIKGETQKNANAYLNCGWHIFGFCGGIFGKTQTFASKNLNIRKRVPQQKQK